MLRCFCLLIALTAFQAFQPCDASAAEKTRVLIVTGGHGFEKEQFFQVFKDNPEITYEAVEHPSAQARFATDESAKYDVVLLYDMYQKLTDEVKTNFVLLLKYG